MLALRRMLVNLGHDCELFFFRHGDMEKHLPADCPVHFGTLADCLRLVHRRQFDVVHVRSSDWNTGVAAARSPETKLIVTSHGFLGPGWNAGNCDAFVACAGWLAVAQQPMTDVPMQVVLNGVDVSRFHPGELQPSSPPIVAWVGRGVDRRKRLDAFAAATPRLVASGLRVWVIDPHGPSAVAARMPEAARTLERTAEFWGGMPVDRMPEVYQTIAASGGCVVSTAEWEGLPLTLLEAQACGCPVIAPDVRGTNECVDPAWGGELYPLETATDDLAGLVLTTLQDEAGMQARRRVCAAHVAEHFSIDRMGESYARMYKDAPFPWRGGLVNRLRARLLLSPVHNWRGYCQHRWRVGREQFAAARTLVQEGEWDAARLAIQASLRTSPTIYLRRERAGLLMRGLLTPDREAEHSLVTGTGD